MPVTGDQASLDWFCHEIDKATNKRHLQNIRGALQSLYRQSLITRRMYNSMNADIRYSIDRLQRVGA